MCILNDWVMKIYTLIILPGFADFIFRSPKIYLGPPRPPWNPAASGNTAAQCNSKTFWCSLSRSWMNVGLKSQHPRFRIRLGHWATRNARAQVQAQAVEMTQSLFLLLQGQDPSSSWASMFDVSGFNANEINWSRRFTRKWWLEPPTRAGWWVRTTVDASPANPPAMNTKQKRRSHIKNHWCLQCWFGRSGSRRPFMPHFGDHGSIHGRNSAPPPVRCVCGLAYLRPCSGGKFSLMNFRNSMAASCHGVWISKGTGKLWTCRNIRNPWLTQVYLIGEATLEKVRHWAMFITNLLPWQNILGRPEDICGLQFPFMESYELQNVKSTTDVKEQPLIKNLPTWRQGLQGDLARFILDSFQPGSTITIGLSFAGRHWNWQRPKDSVHSMFEHAEMPAKYFKEKGLLFHCWQVKQQIVTTGQHCRPVLSLPLTRSMHVKLKQIEPCWEIAESSKLGQRTRFTCQTWHVKARAGSNHIVGFTASKLSPQNRSRK